MNNFYAALSMANSMYDLNIDPATFEDVGLVAWDLIGNKQTKIYRYTTATENCRIKIPCNCEILEAVFTPYIEANDLNPHSATPDFYMQFAEQYTEAWKKNKKALDESGTLVSYRQEGDELVFDKDYPAVTLLYHGIITDEDGLPFISDKETQAIAKFLLYNTMYRKALALRDGNLLQLAQMAQQDWLRACNAARIPAHLTQNDMNDILDVRTRWDRKVYGKSFHPFK